MPLTIAEKNDLRELLNKARENLKRNQYSPLRVWYDGMIHALIDVGQVLHVQMTLPNKNNLERKRKQ